MLRQIRIACSFGLAVLLCGTAFAQFITLTVERIINDDSMMAIEKKTHLVELGEEAVPTLLNYLDAHPHSWRLIVSVLGDIGDQRATEPLLKRLAAEPTELRAVILALEKLKDPRAVEPLVELIGKVRGEEAITALGKIGDPRAEVPILLVLNSEEESVENRIRAATALLEFGSSASKTETAAFLLNETLIERLLLDEWRKSGRSLVRTRSAWWRALRTVGTVEAYATLAPWFDKPLMSYDHAALIKIVAEIQDPSVYLLDTMYTFITTSPQEIMVRIDALEALLNYPEALAHGELLSAWEQLANEAETRNKGWDVPITRLRALRVQLDSKE